MKILFDATVLASEPAGIGLYVEHFLSTYAATFPEDQVTVLARKGMAWPGTESIPVLTPAASAFQRLWVEQTRFPSLIARETHDVVHFPDYRCPIRTPPRTVVTIHDLAVFLYPETFTVSQRRIKRWFTRQSLKRAARIIVPSRTTRNDLIDVLGADPARIDVVPMGHRLEAPPAADSGPPHPRPYFLFVGTLEPRKNLCRLIEALDVLRHQDPDAPDLAVAGKTGWLYEEIFREVARRGLHDRVIFLGYVSADALFAWYRNAVGFCFPTLYEGFGAPVLEAMGAGCPVLTANRGATAEIARDAALLVNPDDPLAIAEGLYTMARDGALRKRLAELGRERAAQYTWERTVRETRRVYEHVLTGD